MKEEADQQLRVKRGSLKRKDRYEIAIWRKGMSGLGTGVAGEGVPGVRGHEFKDQSAGESSEFHPKKLPEIFKDKTFTAALFTIIKLRINLNVQRGWLNEVLYIHSALKMAAKHNIFAKHMT